MDPLTIVIPAYNEEQSLSEFLPEVVRFCSDNGFKLIVVNDASTDSTGGVLDGLMESSVLAVLTHKVNRGYGGAIKTGILAAKSRYVITIDADGQHLLEDVKVLFDKIVEADADMVVGRRSNTGVRNWYRNLGKALIRFVARLLLPLNIHDINSGMKIYDASLAKEYIRLCPDSMAFSDTITLVFISQRHLVIEHPVRIRERVAGSSTISTLTAFETVKEIVNIVILFNPTKIFFPLALLSTLVGIAWGIPIVLKGNGISVGALLAVSTGVIFFCLGLIAEQLSLMRRNNRL